MKKVYVCSPMKGNLKLNMKKAEGYSKYVYKQGCIPITPQIYLEKATGLKEENDRVKLLKLGKELIKLCDECWIFGDIISEGMEGEIKEATKNKIKLKYVKNGQ